MIDLTKIIEIKNVLSNKVINTIQDDLGRIIYEAFKELITSGIPPLILINCSGKDLIDYKIHGNSKQGKLPSEYEYVEYIESTGTQYIDTGIVPNQDIGFDIVFLSKNELNGNTYGSIIGARESSNNRELQLTTYSSGTQGTLRFNTSSLNAGLVYNTKMHCTLRNKVYTNNVDVSHTLRGDFESPNTLTVFALNDANAKNIIQHGKLQLFSLKLYDGDKLIRNYIPCYRKTDDVIGLYDLVENKFYANNGTGTFLKGNYILTPDTPIEIESVGDKTKNLFNKNGEVFEGYNTNISIDKNSIIATSLGSETFQNAKIAIPDIEAGKTITLSSKILASNLNTGRILLGYYDTSTKGTKSITFLDNTGFVTATIPQKTSDTQTLCLIIYSNANGTSTIGDYVRYTDIQLELGNTATDYEPYGYKILVKTNNGTEEITTNIYLNEPLRRVEDFADYIDFKNKRVVRRIIEYKLTGDDEFVTYGGWSQGETYSTGMTYYGLLLPNVYGGTGLNDMGSLICSHFRVSKRNSDRPTTTTPIVQLHYSMWKNLIFIVNANDYPDLETWKNYLREQYNNGTPITVVAVLKEEVTEEPVELPNIPTLKETTILSIESNINSSYMEAVYKGMGDLELFNDDDNLILNDILATDTETELNVTNTEIVEILDEIIGG